MKTLLLLLFVALSSLFASSAVVELKDTETLYNIGLLLIMAGISFMIVEVFVIGVGVLGIGGVTAFIFGSILLFDAGALGNNITISLLIAFSLVSLAFFIMMVRVFLKSRSTKVATGTEEMIGLTGHVVEVTDTGYHVFCHAEVWNAISKVKLNVGESVQVVGLSDLVLEVKPLKE
ncbi:MAG: NfeD family protein [Thiovulaceae bacterium]|nr:NfeD family protein [Sulfurimonadaceae bacterium]